MANLNNTKVIDKKNQRFSFFRSGRDEYPRTGAIHKKELSSSEALKFSLKTTKT